MGLQDSAISMTVLALGWKTLGECVQIAFHNSDSEKRLVRKKKQVNLFHYSMPLEILVCQTQILLCGFRLCLKPQGILNFLVLEVKRVELSSSLR